MIAVATVLAVALTAQAPYGVCAHLTRDEFATRDQTLAMMAKAGIRTVRMDVDWWTQKGPETPIDLSRFEAVLKSAEEAGVAVLPILNSAPKWAVPVTEHLDEFRVYAAAVARMVKGRTPAIEIWNEEDLPANGELADPLKYLKVLQAAYEAIKAVDPNMKVAFGGVSGFGCDYLRKVYAAGGAKYFDIFCCHPYTIPFGPEGRLDKGLEKLRVLMTEFGDAGKPIWITEMGFPTHRNGVGTAETQVLLSGLKIAKPELKGYRVVYAPVRADAVADAFADELRAVLPAGSTVQCGAGQALTMLLNTNGADVVVYPMDSEVYPADSVEAIADFVRRGGVLVETGGAPMYTPMKADVGGRLTQDWSRKPEKDRELLRIGFTAWWLDKDVPNGMSVFATDQAVKAGFKVHPAGYRGSRFITPQFLRDGDEFIPLISGKPKSGREISAAAVLKFASDYKGAVVVCGLQKGFGPIAHSEDEQAKFLVRSAAIAVSEGIERFFTYEFMAPERDPYHSESHFGIVHQDLTSKPAYNALTILARCRSAGSAPLPAPWRNQNRYYPQWTSPDGTKMGMIWTLKPEPDAVLAFDGNGMKFVDAFGRHPDVERVDDGRYRMPLSDVPIYFRGGFLSGSEAKE